MTFIIVTDPVNDDITREEGEFNAMWEKLGHQVRDILGDGPVGTTWCNIGVTHGSDTIGANVFHRTISLDLG